MAKDIDNIEKTKEFPKLKDFEQKIKKKYNYFRVKHINGLRNKHFVNNILNRLFYRAN